MSKVFYEYNFIKKETCGKAYEEDAFLYVFGAGEFVKIGKAKCVDSRLRTQQVGCPITMCILTERKHPRNKIYDIEGNWHVRLRKYHVRGEWFKLPPRIQPVVIKMISQGVTFKEP